MAINYDKTKAILITTCQKLHTLPMMKSNITVKGKVLENVKKDKLLGLKNVKKGKLLVKKDKIPSLVCTY